MKLAVSVLFLVVVVAYVKADCGCLQCSKHLYVATAPGSPIKVIYRGEQGVPLRFPQPPMPINIPINPSRPYTVDQIVLQNYNPVYTVGVSGPCQRTLDYKVQAPVKLPVPLNSICVPKPIRGVARVDRIVLPAPMIRYESNRECNRNYPWRMTEEMKPIRQPIIEQIIPSSCSSPCASPCYAATFRYVSDEDIVQPCDTMTNTPETLELSPAGLGLEVNPLYFFLTHPNSHKSERLFPTHANQQGNDNMQTETTHNVVLREYLESFGCQTPDASSIETRVNDNPFANKRGVRKATSEDTDEGFYGTKENVPNTEPECRRNKRHIPIISSGLNLLYSLIPPFIKNPIQQSLKSAQRDNNQRLAHQRKMRLQEELLAQRQMRRYNPYVGIPSYYQRPKYYPFRQAPLPPPPQPRRRLPSYYSNDIYAEELEDDFLSALAEPSYSPGFYSRSRDDDYDDYVGSPRPKYGRRNDILERSGARSEMSPEERHVFLRKLQRLNGRRNKRSAEENEDNTGNARAKRAIVLDGSQLGLPFFRVTRPVDEESDEYDDDGSVEYSAEYFFREDSSEEDPDGSMLRRKKKKSKHKDDAGAYLNPFDFENLIPQNPIFYFLNTPIRLLNHFDNFRKQLSPVLKSVPKVLVNSRRYLQDFGKTFETGVMDFASNMIGNFQEQQPYYSYHPWSNVVTPARYRRSLPDHNEDSQSKSDTKIENKSESNENANLENSGNNDGEKPQISDKYLPSHRNNVIKMVAQENGDAKELGIPPDVSEQNSNAGRFYPEYEPVFDEIYKNDERGFSSNENHTENATDINEGPSELTEEDSISNGRFYPEYAPMFNTDSSEEEDAIYPEIKERFLSENKSQTDDISDALKISDNKKDGNSVTAKMANRFSEKRASDDSVVKKDLIEAAKEKSLSHGYFHPNYSVFFKEDNIRARDKERSLTDSKTDSIDTASTINGDNKGENLTSDYNSNNATENTATEDGDLNKNNLSHSRKKRYLLKMVDDSEVASFIHDTLGQIMAPFYQDTEEVVGKSRKKSCRNCHNDEDEYRPPKKSSKKQYVIEKLYPKIIIDNNGRPFIEIDGAKRPLIFNKNKKKQQKSSHPEETRDRNKCKFCGENDDSSPESLEEFNFESRISNLIEKTKRHVETQEDNYAANSVQYSEMPVKTIKEKIKQLLAEIDALVAMDFEPYMSIYGELLSLEHLKNTVCEDWKQMVMSDRINDVKCKIRLLDSFKKLQLAKDELVRSIANVLQCDNTSFMTKKLIKMLVRLQKLQCIIFKAVEDAEEKLKCNGNFDINREIKYIDYLCNLKFVVGRSRQDLECDLKKERDEAVESDMTMVEKLRELLEMPEDCQDINDISRLLWETRNLDKLQRDTVESLNDKIKHKQKIRKELKILFDLMKQIESNEQNETELLRRTKKQKKYSYGREYYAPKNEKYHDYVAKRAEMKDKYNSKRSTMKEYVGAKPKRVKTWSLRHHPILEDKKPVKIVSNGYTLRGYKLTDAFD